MASEALEVKKKQTQDTKAVERTRSQACFAPAVDIYERDNAMLLIADMPGVDEKSVDITLENNVLTIQGTVEPPYRGEYQLIYSEYELGDFRRAFTLTDEIDRDKIEATVKSGVLTVVLPKAAAAAARKIEVKTG